MNVKLRKACLSDSEMILSWRNEPSTIPWMATTRELDFEEHHTWFSKSIEDPHCLFFIIEAGTIPAGQIRYHKCATEWLENASKVSINITESMHGKGIASLAFRKGSEIVRAASFSDNIFAYVRPNNIGSIKAMENAGFTQDKIVNVNNEPHLIMIDRI